MDVLHLQFFACCFSVSVTSTCSESDPDPCKFPNAGTATKKLRRELDFHWRLHEAHTSCVGSNHASGVFVSDKGDAYRVGVSKSVCE